MKIGVDARLLSIPLTGIGRYSHEMVNALLRHGAELTLFSPAPIIHPLEGRCEIRTWRAKGSVGRVVWGHGILPRWVRESGVDAFWGPAHRLPGSLPKGVRSCVTIHDLVWKHAGETMRPLSRLMDKTFMPQAIRRADCVVAVSDSTRRDILRQWPEMTAPVHTIYPGIARTAQPLDATALQRWAISQPYCLFVGTVEPRKNLRRLIDAYARLPEAARQVSLVIAGGRGWGDTDLAAAIHQAGLGERVRLTGYVDESELATLYAHAHALAMPSLYEGFGLPLVEAMAYGLPILTGNGSSMPEVAGDAAITVDPLDVDAMARGLETLFLDEDVRARLAAAGRERMRLFDWDAAAAGLLALLGAPSSRAFPVNKGSPEML